MYDTIVVGYDGSGPSRAALKEAAAWVKSHGGKVVVVNAAYFDEEEPGAAPGQMERRLELGKRICRQAADDAARDLGVQAETIVCNGEAPEVIADVAREKRAGLIALGTYGKKGLKRLIMGSVTASVISHSPCDVLVVRKPREKCSGDYASILVPFDGSEFSRRALERACALSKPRDAVITVLYVIPRYEEMVEFFKTEAIRKRLFEEAGKVTRQAEDIAAKAGVTAGSEIAEGYPEAEIIEASRRLNNDLIIMGTYGWKGVTRALMGSTTERVIMNAPCPVLVVR